MTTVETLPAALTGEQQTGWTVAQKIEGYIQDQPQTVGVYDPAVSSLQAGIHISPAAAAELTAVAEYPQFIGVEILPGIQLGAGDSQHQVTFGNVAVTIGEQVIFTKVAIKPFEREDSTYNADIDLARHEHDALVAARSRGLDTYFPLALAKNGDTTYLLTEFRPEVESMDNVDWTINPSDEKSYKEVEANLHFIAGSMADMHAVGIMHGDAHPKNYARSDTGKAVIIDLEDGIVAHTIEDSAKLIQQGDDLAQFWFGATHPLANSHNNILLVGQPPEVCIEQFERNILKPYLAALYEKANPDLLALIDAPTLYSDLMRRISH